MPKGKFKVYPCSESYQANVAKVHQFLISYPHPSPTQMIKKLFMVSGDSHCHEPGVRLEFLLMVLQRDVF